jgi:hypothetical protein
MLKTFSVEAIMSNVMLPGWQNLPAALEVLTAKKENELVTCLLKDVNSVFYTGLDENPNMSRSASRPLSKDCHEKKKTSTEATLTVGGSNATRLAEALANLGIDSKLATPGWKLNKENAEKIVPDLKEILETIPKDAPVIFFCMDNTVFKVATAEGGAYEHLEMRRRRRRLPHQRLPGGCTRILHQEPD